MFGDNGDNVHARVVMLVMMVKTTMVTMFKTMVTIFMSMFKTMI